MDGVPRGCQRRSPGLQCEQEEEPLFVKVGVPVNRDFNFPAFHNRQPLWALGTVREAPTASWHETVFDLLPFWCTFPDLSKQPRQLPNAVTVLKQLCPTITRMVQQDP